MTLHYYSKQVYGKTVYYLVNPRIRVQWYKLTGRKTITLDDIELLKSMTGVGFERNFEEESE